jgi:predicted nucleotidyltransferase
MRSLIFGLIVLALTSCGSKRNSVSINDDKLYFDKSVSVEEAMTVLKWMKSINHNWGYPRVDFHLSQKNGTYLFQYPVQIKNAENEEGNISYMQTFADKLSSDALNGKPVVVRLTDDDWEKEKRLVTSGSGRGSTE